jgi:oligopeptide transport system substrate-binding protein
MSLRHPFARLSTIAALSFQQVASPAVIPPGARLAKTQILRKGNNAEPRSIDPQKVDDMQGMHVVFDLFEGLVTLNGKAEIIPGLAESWTLSKDGLVYTFKLRKNVKWSDGSPLTAEDALHGFIRLVDPKVASSYSFMISPIKNGDDVLAGKKPTSELGIKVINPETLQITLKQPTPYFLELMAHPSLYPVHKASIEKHGDSFTLPGKLVSSGAYTLSSWTPGDKIVLKKNPHYYSSKETVIETVSYHPIQKATTELQMFKGGQLDWTYDVPADHFAILQKDMKNELRVFPILASNYYTFNSTKAPFKNNPKLIQAFSMVIDRDTLTKSILGRGEISSYDVVAFGTKSNTAFEYSWSKLPIDKRIAMAKDLFAQAGFSEKNPLKFNLLIDLDETNKKIALAITSMIKKALVHVDITLEQQEWKVFLKNRQGNQYEAAMDRWYGDFNDATTFLDLFRIGNPLNDPRYNNTAYDSLLDKAALEQNPTSRKQILAEASKTFHGDYPVVPLFTYVGTRLVKTAVGGYLAKNPLGWQSTRELYIVETP